MGRRRDFAVGDDAEISRNGVTERSRRPVDPLRGKHPLHETAGEGHSMFSQIPPDRLLGTSESGFAVHMPAVDQLRRHAVQLEIVDETVVFALNAEINIPGNHHGDVSMSVPQQALRSQHAGVLRFTVDGGKSAAGDVIFKKDERHVAGEQPGNIRLGAVGKRVGQQHRIGQLPVQPAAEIYPGAGSEEHPRQTIAGMGGKCLFEFRIQRLPVFRSPVGVDDDDAPFVRLRPFPDENSLLRFNPDQLFGAQQFERTLQHPARTAATRHQSPVRGEPVAGGAFFQHSAQPAVDPFDIRLYVSGHEDTCFSALTYSIPLCHKTDKTVS